jgi:hypothetical protein
LTSIYNLSLKAAALTMSAPLAKGMPIMFCLHRPVFIVRPTIPQHRYYFVNDMPIRRANPVVPGIIIAATIVVAAGIAIYENEQIRVWLDERRRRLAVALYDIGDNISPSPSALGSEASVELNRQRRLDIVRRNRAALIRRAREEGIAVDLDELSAIGREPEMEQRRPSSTSFDDFVRTDGTLKNETGTDKADASGSAAQSSSTNSNIRQRGLGARGLASGAHFGNHFGNPFDDDAQLLFDRDLIAPSPGEHPKSQAATSTVQSISPRPASTIPSIIDIPIMEALSSQSEPQTQYKTDDELEAEIQEAIRRSLEDMPPAQSAYSPPTIFDNAPSASFSPPTTHTLSRDTTADLTGLDDSLYALPSPRLLPEYTMEDSYAETYHPQPINTVTTPLVILDTTIPHDGILTPRGTGTLTPTSEISAFSSALSSGLPSTRGADDDEREAVPLDVRSLASDDDVFDAQSEAGMSETYSMLGGASTPGSWTDVDTDAEGEEINGSRATQI